ncbi:MULTISPECIES: iron-containing redox enzyme family protein [Kitasatospora]|uniref:Iron-containing redox enzyme family protein n=1 Tax=Kitasatospora cathayae TaxID=3004092 RepID=A0ABY7PXM6_9ACTN|nr:iron-containing redox enzyme family protein [Kitasatospora sp. HUAS 3-15]WBP85195.1 iron-containing redox enzyme family protein [Kitasatospora sp. HUAS 3-15]
MDGREQQEPTSGPGEGTPDAPLPAPRGPLSAAVLELVADGPPGTGPRLTPLSPSHDPWGEDHQLALHLCYELHDRGLPGVDPGWEWDPGLLALRRELEESFLAAVHAETQPVPPLRYLLEQLLAEPSADFGPSHFLLAEGERQHAREYLVHRSVYHLKEADPQLWVLPRIHGPAQATLMAIAYDEYGAGRPERAHCLLFARMMAAFGLDPGYGRYRDLVPAPMLAVVNLMTLFGLHRALRGAAVGQFAAIEITSSPGSARLAEALERMGGGADGTLFYREHVEADAVHEQLVRRGVIAELLATEPELAEDIAFGIAAATTVDARFAEHLLGSWRAGRTSLRSPLADVAV